MPLSTVSNLMSVALRAYTTQSYIDRHLGFFLKRKRALCHSMNTEDRATTVTPSSRVTPASGRG